MASIFSLNNSINSGQLDVAISQLLLLGTDKSMEVLDVGDIKFDFDVPDSGNDAKSLYVRIGDSTMTVRNSLTDGTDFYGLVDGNGLNPFKTAFTLTANSGSVYNFSFYSYRSDVKINEKDRTCSIKLRPIYYGGKGVNDYFRGNVDGLDPVGDGYSSKAYISNEENTNVVSSGRFIIDTLKSFSGYNDYIFESNTHVYSNVYSNGVGYNLIADPQLPSGDRLVPDAVVADSMLDTLFVLAGADGAIFGTSFNKNFYVRRVSDNNKVTISYSDIEDIESDPKDYEYETINVTSLGGNDYDLNSLYSTSEETYNDLANKTFSFTAKISLNLYGQWRNNVQPNPPVGSYYSNVFFLGDDGQGSKINVAPSVTGYAAALGADGESRISLTVFGIDTILPWTPFEISSTLSGSLPSGIENRHSGIVYRPSSLVYLLKEDKIKIKAYKIG